MNNLIKAEWFKLSKSFGFKVLLWVNAAALLSTIELIYLEGIRRTGYELLTICMGYVFHHTVVGYIFAAVFVSSEFSNRTIGLSLLCGCSRRKVFLAKAIVFFIGLLLLFFVYACSTVVETVVDGFGMEWSVESFINILQLLFCGILGCMAMGAVMLLVTLIVKKAIGTIGLGIGITYTFMFIENNTRHKPLFFVKYLYIFPIRQLGYRENGVSLGMFLAVEGATFIIAMVASMLIFERIELK